MVDNVGGSGGGDGEESESGPEWRHGPMLLFGRSADLVSALAEQAVATDGAGLDRVSAAGKLLKNVVAAGWADASTVHTFVLEEGCDTDSVSRAIRGALATAPVCHPGALASVVYVRRSDEPREQWAVRVNGVNHHHSLTTNHVSVLPLAAFVPCNSLRCKPSAPIALHS